MSMEVITLKLTITKSKNSTCFYVQKSIRKPDGKISTVTVEKLGNLDIVRTRANGQDPFVWAKNYVEELNKMQYEEKKNILVSYAPTKLINKDEQLSFNCGYLFLQDVYYSLGLNRICAKISKKHQFQYDLNDILSKLVYTRILYPSSKLSSYEMAKKLLEQPSYQIHDIYRALDVLVKENDFIQSELYKNSLKIIERNKNILYYDTTNYYFEIEMEDEHRKYGKSKEHRPNPIVGMGLFIDHDGIPLACTVFPGSNEQPTLLPLEKKIINDFGIENLVVCTDSGLSSTEMRKFNNLELFGEQIRGFITVQSLKKIKKELQEWALNPNGWKLPGDKKEYCLDTLDDDADKEKIYYKEKWIKEDISAKKEKAGIKPLEQRFIVSYSLKYRDYLRAIRNEQIERAKKLIDKGDDCKTNEQNNPRRFIKTDSATADGEIADQKQSYLNMKKISEEEKFDGFYAICTNLDHQPISEILRVNQKRWQVEECFRIMKTDFKSRPVFLQRDDRIKAHFLTCFLALYIYRILEKKISKKYTCTQILDTLRNMNLIKAPDNAGYTPAYTRTDITDTLHETFGFRTDYQISSSQSMRKVIGKTKK